MNALAVTMATLLAMVFVLQYLSDQCTYVNPALASRLGFLSVACGYFIIILFVAWVFLLMGWK